MAIDIDVQRAAAGTRIPDNRQFRKWARVALREHGECAVLIRIVDEDESEELNSRFRGQHKATNVLSFPAELPAAVNLPLLGDIVICAPLVDREAKEQGKAVESHWAHLTIHGILHLLGHDHLQPDEAAEMEGLEIFMLESLGIANPYT